MFQFAFGQCVLLKHDIDCLQVEFRGHVADRAIFIVESLRRGGALLITDDEVLLAALAAHAAG
jgi:hypothetical protein